jgi:RNA ligase partner protein
MTKSKTQFVLDTSLFVNPASASAYGANPTEAFTRFLEMVHEAHDVACFMPPSIYKELMHFAEEPKIPSALLSGVRQQPPKKHEIHVPGFFIYNLVESFRDRVDRGLRLAERHVREALQMPAALVSKPKETFPEPGDVRPDAKLISGLRESFRRMMREGMLDSKADVDLLLLAYELPATLVSADEGVLFWAENMGIEILPYEQLPAYLKKSAMKKT